MNASASEGGLPTPFGPIRLVRSSWILGVTLALLAMAAAPAAEGQSIRLVMDVNGTTVMDKTGSSSFGASHADNNAQGQLAGRVFQSGDLIAKANVSGLAAASGRVTARSRAGYLLTPPVPADFAGGKLFIYVTLGGELVGKATLDLSITVEAFTAQWDSTGSVSGAVTNQPGNERIELVVIVPLPATLDPTRTINVDPSLVLNAVAFTTPAGGVIQSSSVDATDAKMTGFRVLNAAGVQVTGFSLKGPKQIPERAPPPPGQGIAIEYYNAAFEHYFITAGADEIIKLDSGVIAGWERTGQSFNVYTTPDPSRAAVCRFFSTAFGTKSSHFYAPRGLGCEPVLSNPSWQYEGDAFYTFLPNANGDCPAGNIPIYRLYNQGQGGAPNHRFTTSESIRLEMLRENYVPEGYGIGVGMCSPQ